MLALNSPTLFNPSSGIFVSLIKKHKRNILFQERPGACLGLYYPMNDIKKTFFMVQQQNAVLHAI